MKLWTHVKRTMLVLFLVFILPALASAGWWIAQKPELSWRNADWGATGLLGSPGAEGDAAVHILSARTGGLKGAFATHSWIVIKRPGSTSYERYDKVGWGMPIRKNGFAPDGKWYSNDPEIVTSIRGAEAAQLIAKVDAAIDTYPHAGRGGYRLWPGPNSNSFVAHVLREVPELDAALPPNAVGRDYLSGGRWFLIEPDGKDIHLTLFGLAGVSAGLRSGFEVHFIGLVAGFDFRNPAIKIPAFGRVGL